MGRCKLSNRCGRIISLDQDGDPQILYDGELSPQGGFPENLQLLIEALDLRVAQNVEFRDLSGKWIQGCVTKIGPDGAAHIEGEGRTVIIRKDQQTTENVRIHQESFPTDTID